MSFVTSTLKVVVGLAVFASLMVLEFASYTRAIAEEVHPPAVMKSQEVAPPTMAETVKKSGKILR